MAGEASGWIAHADIESCGVAKSRFCVFPTINRSLAADAGDVCVVPCLDLGEGAACRLRNEDHPRRIGFVGSGDGIPVRAFLLGEVFVLIGRGAGLNVVVTGVLGLNVIFKVDSSRDRGGPRVNASIAVEGASGVILQGMVPQGSAGWRASAAVVGRHPE